MPRISPTICALGAFLVVVAPDVRALADKAPPGAPYALPFQLRSVVAASVLRSDTTVALHSDPAGRTGATVASMVFASYRVIPELAPFVRYAVVGNAPAVGQGAAAFVNPLVGATGAFRISRDFRLAVALGVTIPIGMAGGNAPEGTMAAATKAGILARSALDNAMFAVNDVAILPGVDVAYVAHGLTVQLEGGLFQLVRVRGEAVQPDAFKTNLTCGLSVGYFVIKQLSIGAELRYQRWLSDPVAVMADRTGASRDNLSVATGARGNFPLVEGMWLRPGLSYARGVDDPMNAQAYNIVQVDLALAY